MTEIDSRRVLHITGEFPPWVSGGLGTYVYEVATSLSDRGHDVEVLVVRGDLESHDQQSFDADEISVSTVAVASDGTSLPTGITNGHRLADATLAQSDISDVIERLPDVIHVHDWYGVAPMAALTDRVRIPCVYSAHLPQRSGFTYTGHGIEKKTKARIEAAGLRLADLVVAPSEFVRQEVISEYHVRPDRVVVYPNGIDTDFFHPSSTGGNEGTERPTVLFVGRVTDQKGVRYLLDAAEAIHDETDAVIDIVGTGPLLEGFKRRVRRDGLSEVVNFEGFVSRTSLATRYRNASVVVAPSVYEPFGLVVVEAMASGTPVVCFSLGGMREIVREGIDGRLAQPGSADELAAATIDVCQWPNTKGDSESGPRERAIEFDIDRLAASLSDAYEAVTDHGRRPETSEGVPRPDGDRHREHHVLRDDSSGASIDERGKE